MNDNNICINVKKDYSDDEIFMGLINKYYTPAEIEVATDRISKIVQSTVEREVEKYQKEVDRQYNERLRALAQDEIAVKREQEKLGKGEKENAKAEKKVRMSFFVVVILYLLYALIFVCKVFLPTI